MELANASKQGTKQNLLPLIHKSMACSIQLTNMSMTTDWDAETSSIISQPIAFHL